MWENNCLKGEGMLCDTALLPWARVDPVRFDTMCMDLRNLCSLHVFEELQCHSFGQKANLGAFTNHGVLDNKVLLW